MDAPFFRRFLLGACVLAAGCAALSIISSGVPTGTLGFLDGAGSRFTDDDVSCVNSGLGDTIDNPVTKTELSSLYTHAGVDLREASSAVGDCIGPFEFNPVMFAVAEDPSALESAEYAACIDSTFVGEVYTTHVELWFGEAIADSTDSATDPADCLEEK